MICNKLSPLAMILVLILSMGALAETPKNQSQAEKFALTPYTPVAYEFFPASKLELKAVRNPSNIQLSDSMISEEARKLRDRYFAIKTSEDLALLINEADTTFSSFKERDSKLYAALLASMKPYRGLIYRLKPIVESEKVIHSMVLSNVMSLASSIKFAFNSHTNEIAFEYFAAPYKAGGNLVNQIQTEDNFVEWLAQDVKSTELKLMGRLHGISFDKDSSDNIVIDKALVFGSGTFKDGVNRYERMGEVEKQLIILGLELQVASINMVRAYNQTGSLRLSREMGNLFGIDGFLFNKVDGVTLYDVKNVLRHSKYSDLYTLKQDGRQYMAEAYEFLKSAGNRLGYIWSAVQLRNADDSFFINSGLINAELPRVELAVKKTISLINGSNPDGSTPLKSNVTSEVATYNIKNFFMNPPTDLKQLLPTKFDMEKTKKTQKSQISYRNYYYGSPTSWDLSKYKSIFPQAKNSSDIVSAIRVWKHSSVGMVRLPVPGVN